ncbi:sugar-binding protein [Nonomuraea sp. NPDC050786]|uniref:sugar-binding protein n=1 Tax=Nonomuraea sp. NPDC050786 TaxID=3154840 RepID=UPI0033F0C2D1
MAPGTLLGFDIQVNDATGTARTSTVTSNDGTGRSYLDTSHRGLLPRSTPTTPNAVRTWTRRCGRTTPWWRRTDGMGAR